jgi:hypothetical protein
VAQSLPEQTKLTRIKNFTWYFLAGLWIRIDLIRIRI